MPAIDEDVQEGGGGRRHVRVPHPAGGGRGRRRRGGAHLLPDGAGRPRRQRPAPPGQGGGLGVRLAVRRGHDRHRGETRLLLPAGRLPRREGQAEDRRGQPRCWRGRAPAACSPAATSSPARRRSPTAMNAGHEAARSINAYLMGAGAALPGEAADGRPRRSAGLHHRPGLPRLLPAAVRPRGGARTVAHRAPAQPHRRGDRHPGPRRGGGRGQPLLQLRLRGGQLLRPGPRPHRAGRPDQDVAPRHRRRGLLLRGRQHAAPCSKTARWCSRCRCRSRRAGARSAFIKFAIRKSIDFPVVNCAAALELDGGVVKSARICLNSVYGLPMRVDRRRAVPGRQDDRPGQRPSRPPTPAMEGRLPAAQQPLQDPDSPDPGQASDPGLRLAARRLSVRRPPAVGRRAAAAGARTKGQAAPVSVRSKIFHAELQRLIGSPGELRVEGATVGECLADLVRRYPQAEPLMFDSQRPAAASGSTSS